MKDSVKMDKVFSRLELRKKKLVWGREKRNEYGNKVTN